MIKTLSSSGNCVTCEVSGVTRGGAPLAIIVRKSVIHPVKGPMLGTLTSSAREGDIVGEISVPLKTILCFESCTTPSRSAASTEKDIEGIFRPMK